MFFPDFGTRYRAAIAAERESIDMRGYAAMLRDAVRRTAELVRVLRESR